MRFVLDLAGQRVRHRATTASHDDQAALLWDLAERYHPEEAWLAQSYLRGERSGDELSRTAPRGTLAPGLLAAVRPRIEGRSHRAFTDERESGLRSVAQPSCSSGWAPSRGSTRPRHLSEAER